MPDLSFETIWPKVQVVIEPFSQVIEIVVVVGVAAMLLVIFWKIFRS